MIHGDNETGSSIGKAVRTLAMLIALVAGLLQGTPANAAPAPGWRGSQLLNPATDDWEPAVAADPNAPYVYILTTRYGQPKTCSSHCPTPYLALTISSDNGKTWGPQVPLCVCRGSKAQYDPIIEVVKNTGAVYALFLNGDRAGGFSTVFTKSTDHGQTWTTPVHTYSTGWTDKPNFAITPSGKHIYASWNGNTGGDPWIGISHDYGKTWKEKKLVDSRRYYYAYDGLVMPNGTIVLAQSSLVYQGPSVPAENGIWYHLFTSNDQGKTWKNRIVAKMPVGSACTASGCPEDYYQGQPSVAFDSSGKLIYAYHGPSGSGGEQRVYVKVSGDAGATWGAAKALSVDGENALQPRIASRGAGNARIWFMQTTGGDEDVWNVWYRSSSDSGRTWSSPVRISDAAAGAAPYVTANGFLEVYGDYGEIAITSAGKTIAVWGEGASYNGPGGTWFNIQS